MDIKRAIFHIPYHADLKHPSGSNIRPWKIINALKHKGYEVEIIMGYGKERSRRIKEVKEKIQKGYKYDFLYTESSTEPTLLTEKNHLPMYPFLDFNFFKYCKKRGIKIGLFYRDIYWRFSIYDSVPFVKREIAKLFYMYDLKKYNNLIDVLYLPCKKMLEYIPLKMNCKIEELPPAVSKVEAVEKILPDQYLKIFYVGGISGLYNLELLFKVINKTDNVKLTVCCRENEWKSNKNIYEKYLNDRIEIVHKSGEELEEYMKAANVFSMLFEPSEYRTFAIPVKLFEYMEYNKPIIATEGTAAGEFIKKNNMGWSIQYNEDHISNTISKIISDINEYKSKLTTINETVKNNTWEKRVEKIISDLKS